MTYSEDLNNETPEDAITVLSEEQSLERMKTQSVGRLVVRRANDMDIFPINFVVDTNNPFAEDGTALYFRTAEGTKLFTVNLNADVLFEVDEFHEGENAWSVVVKGTAALVKDTNEANHADTLGLKPWVPTLKYNFVRITPKSISGRAFVLGEEPERY